VILAGLFSGFAAEVHAQTCDDGDACNRSSSHKVLHVDGDTYSLQSAIAAANSSGNTSVIISSNQTLTTGLTLTGTGVELTCQNHATLTAGGAGFWMVKLLARKIHDFRSTKGLAMVQIRYRGGFETKSEAFT